MQEEIGLHGAKQLDADDAACDLCLVLDADGTPGGIVVGAPTHYTFKAEFTAGPRTRACSPRAGISAIRMAADAIGRMELGRLDAGTTANVGSIDGGTATNVDRCSLRADRGVPLARSRARRGGARRRWTRDAQAPPTEHGGERRDRVDSRVRGLLGR